MLLSLASTAKVLVVGHESFVAVWMCPPLTKGQPPCWIVPLSLVMLKLGRFWLFGELGVMVRHQVFCSVFVEIDRVPLLVGVRESVFDGGVPDLALATSTSVLACFSSDFRAVSLADFVMPL